VHAPSYSKPHAFPLQHPAVPAGLFGHVVATHCPLALHVCSVAPEHVVAPGVHTPVHAPPTHACWVHVETGESDTRSGPHRTAVVGLLHTAWPGLALEQGGSTAWQVPWLTPTALSQSSPELHVWLYAHTPPLQRSVTFCALPLHASVPSLEHGQPSFPTAPVPRGAQASGLASLLFDDPDELEDDELDPLLDPDDAPFEDELDPPLENEPFDDELEDDPLLDGAPLDDELEDDPPPSAPSRGAIELPSATTSSASAGPESGDESATANGAPPQEARRRKKIGTYLMIPSVYRDRFVCYQNRLARLVGSVYHKNRVDAAPTLQAITRAMDRAGLEAILVGNAAAALLGARVTTMDFDFMIRSTPGNLRKLRKIADDLGGTLFQPYYPSSRMYRLERDDGLQVDFLMQMDGIRSFESLRSRSSQLDLDRDWSVLVASLSDIIKSKRAAGRPKDVAVLPELEATHRERKEKGL
jgi:hypothetical protein